MSVKFRARQHAVEHEIVRIIQRKVGGGDLYGEAKHFPDVFEHVATHLRSITPLAASSHALRK